MADFAFETMFPLGEDTTEYRLISADHVAVSSFNGREMLTVAPEGLTLLAEAAFRDVSHLYRASHLNLLTGIFDDPEASDNDRMVAMELLRNAVISAEGEFPCARIPVRPSSWQKGAAGLDRRR